MEEKEVRVDKELEIDESQLTEEQKQDNKFHGPKGLLITCGVLVVLIIVCIVVILVLGGNK